MDYEDYWEEIKPIGLQERGRIFSRIITRGSSVLDIGCGDGSNLLYLIQNNSINGEGIDISSNAVERVKKAGINAWIDDVTRDDFKLTKRYDYIILSEILEHIPQPELLLAKIRDNFDKALLVSIPNIGYYTHRLRLLFGRFPIQWQLHPGEHLRFWTLKGFDWWTKSLELKIIGMYPSKGLPVLYKYFPTITSKVIATRPNLLTISAVFVLTRVGQKGCLK